MARWQLELPPHGEWELCISVTGVVEGTPIECRHTCAEPLATSPPIERLRAWRASKPVADTDDVVLLQALEQTSDDLGALRLVDPTHPKALAIAAGAPWFMTLFGRDALITAYMALIADHSIAAGVLGTLARLQGVPWMPRRKSSPVGSSTRSGSTKPSTSFADGTIYFGSIDATPLFVMLVGERHRWRLPSDVLDGLTDPVDRALTWIEEFGDRDGDGYVEYQRSSPDGLLNQGWKDSWDGITFAGGTLPKGPIALREVQGYVYAADLARALMADGVGDAGTVAEHRGRAADLKARFNRDFWIEDGGYVALALDGEKRPVDALASNMGHCLSTGILDVDKASSVAEHLMSPPMFSGWGVRTLAETMEAFNPISYHNGIRLAPRQRDHRRGPRGTAMSTPHIASSAPCSTSVPPMEDAFPSCSSGLVRHELSAPRGHPTSCIPQAWAAASPLLFRGHCSVWIPNCARAMSRSHRSCPRGRAAWSSTRPDRAAGSTSRRLGAAST